MNKLLCLPWIALALLIAPGRVFAAVDNDGLDCASATELSSGKTYSGNTKYSNDFIEGIGPYSSPGKDRVYTFTATESTGPISIDWADYDFAAFVTTDCRTLAPAPLTVVTSSTPAQLDLSSLAGGQRYYLIVTGNPAASTDIEGAYSLSTTWLGPDGNGDGGLACASATELSSGMTYSGNTKYSTSFVSGIGGLPSPGRDHAYTFVAAETTGPISVDWADYNYTVFVTTDCRTLASASVTAVAGPTPAQLDLSSLTPGQRYYLIVTGNPAASTDIEGAYSLSTTWLGPDGNGDGGLDCASATELLPDTAYVGDTRYAGNPIESQGPIPNASNDHVYTFTATADSWVLAVEWANYDFFAFLSNTCDSHVDVPPVFAMTTAPAYLDLSGLVPGQRYYVIVSGTNPFTPGDQGAYVLATPWAKTHLSDAIFSSGFD